MNTLAFLLPLALVCLAAASVMPSGACEEKCHKGPDPVRSCSFRCDNGALGHYKRYTRCDPKTEKGAPGYCDGLICVAVNGAPDYMPPAPSC